ncbi:hypothetical protein BDZ91DRAFT_715567 [Kalaharituber pfeilii]|nr:hypothetical protein BDZ91DRAFT_715567 [Kalaharituber pfeilii]
MVEIRPYGGNGAQAKSVARVLQLKGAASSLRRVVQELVKVCKRSKILVEDNLETSLMETRLESEAA